MNKEPIKIFGKNVILLASMVSAKDESLYHRIFPMAEYPKHM